MKDFYYYTGLIAITITGVICLSILFFYVSTWFINKLGKYFKTIWIMAEYAYYRKQFKDWVIGKAVIFPKGAGFDLGDKYMEDYSWSTLENLSTYEVLDNYLDYHLPSDFNVLFRNNLYCEVLNRKTRQAFQVSVLVNHKAINKHLNCVTFKFLRYVH